MQRTPSWQYVDRLAFAIVIAGGLGVLAGWYWDVPILKSVLPGYISMKPNTALGLMALGCSGWLASPHPTPSWRRVLSQLLALGVLILAGLTISEYILHRDLRIDEWLFSDPEAMKTRWPPGRFAPVTGVSFALIGGAILLKNARHIRARKAAEAMLLISWLAAFQGFIGYLAGVKYSFGSAYFTQIAIHSALLLIFLTTGLLWSNQRGGYFESLAGSSISGRLGRSLLITAVVIPPLINLLQIEGKRAGWWDEDFGILLRVLGNVSLFSWVAVRTASELAKSERLRAESERNEREQLIRLRTITDAMPAFVSFVDSDGRYRFVNQAYENWFGKPGERIQGKHLREVLGGDAYLHSVPYFDRVRSGQSARFESQLVAWDGSTRFFDVEYIPSAEGFVIMAYDITERKRTEAELQSAVKIRDEFLSIASHELKTPVTSLMLQLDLANRMPLPAPFSRTVEISSRQVARLAQLIEDLLDVARIEAGRMTLSLEPVDLSSLATEIAERLRPQFEATGATLEVLRADQVVLLCDRFRIEQVIVNLITNSLKYGAGKPVQIQVSQDSRDALVEVRDHGIGIADERISRIFDRFERAISYHNISGLGLGLYISRQIVEAHGGTITVQTELREGSCFLVKLPLAGCSSA